jgi:uncharacterized membrane protein
MTDDHPAAPSEPGFRAILMPYRSLGPTGFLVLMVFISLVSLMSGIAFLMMGAWPVFFFFGLDVLLIYLAFRLNYRSGRQYETVEIFPRQLILTRVHPSGRRESFDFNPYWVRVLLHENPQGRTELQLASHGRRLSFGRFLTDDEKRDFADELRRALATSRTAI